MTDPGSPATMCEAFQQTVARYPQQVALRALGGAATITWAQYAARVRQIAAGLAGLGVRPGDTVALMMTNRIEFHLVDTAAFHLGAVPFSVYNTFHPGHHHAGAARTQRRPGVRVRGVLAGGGTR